jgi:hypothetical protein
MSDTAIAWTRVAIFALILVAVAAISGLFVYTHVAPEDASASADAGAPDTLALAQIQKHLDSIDNRLAELETRRKADVAKTEADLKDQEAAIERQASTLRASRPAQYQIAPSSALPSRPSTAPAPQTDPAEAQKVAKLQEGVGALQAEATTNREAWQATTNRLAEVAGELGSQHGQILQSQDELNRFLGRTQHTALTFELRRGSDPESVGPIRIALKTANQKSQRYTLCVYVQKACLKVQDRLLYEVVQLAVSKDEAPLELIATRVGRDGIAGYLEVPGTFAAR